MFSSHYIDEFLNIDVSKQYSASRFPRLFYIWGYSFEFERDNNRELLENICIKLSNKSDIWYATNMEVYNYVQAYNALSFSADGTIIYNPTLYTVWFDTPNIAGQAKNRGAKLLIVHESTYYNPYI